MIFDLPCEVIDHCENFMTRETFCNWRLVRKDRNWETKHIKSLSTERLKKQNTILRQHCVHNNCLHDCLTYLTWTCGHQKSFVPWCLIHTPHIILNEIDLFCIGETNEYGSFLLNEID